jgi:hypothetical protein
MYPYLRDAGCGTVNVDLKKTPAVTTVLYSVLIAMNCD